mmetsp:Transcript_10095/g.15120  ORF Transcript_10095/g.15120 Transcript_10095/m.15120 type:complete len:549 (-) Transcript_10095:108-1754(-)|eukprot:CAMPEP_0203672478 /NCGR_PEP_ID=MMETSP0090-20130426/8539_1 /ASSEMBLY_ACC=CAM_ASM_001088 /TAXON_ID=426623 /ORGANISM="Chaetoceros affinis, Strain CCMP159" /LENGTH=548 /DNA_ID=CAMNT_0050537803 /DNA_START=178 /DNA_END=1824 /DNA_ORIENTATION=+
MSTTAVEMTQEAASKEVREVALELNTIKNEMKKIALGGDNEEEKENSFKVTALKITGLPESAQPKIKVELTSPIEEQIITKLYDPLDDNDDEDKNDSRDSGNGNGKDNDGTNEEKEEAVEGDDEEAKEESTKDEDGDDKNKDDSKTEDKEDEVKDGNGDADVDASSATVESPAATVAAAAATPEAKSYVIFKGVDISVATMTINVSDLDIPLGSSAMYDVGPLCEIDVLGGVTKKVTQLEVAIVPKDDGTDIGISTDGGGKNVPTTTAAAATTNDATDNDGGDGGDGGDDETGEEAESQYFLDAVSEEAEGGETTEKTVDADAAEDGEEKGEDQEEGDDETGEKTSSNAKSESNDESIEVVVEEFVDTAEEEKAEEESETKEDEKKEASAEAAATTTPAPAPEEESKGVIVPTCVLSLKIEYNASKGDQQAILEEKYNATVARQAVAVEKLRKIAIAARRAQMAAAASSSSASGTKGENAKPAIKPGFLSKKSKKKEPMFLVRWYEKTIGPNSLFMKVYPIAKNYVLFFGGVFLMHFHGHQLSLPPPV